MGGRSIENVIVIVESISVAWSDKGEGVKIKVQRHKLASLVFKRLNRLLVHNIHKTGGSV